MTYKKQITLLLLCFIAQTLLFDIHFVLGAQPVTTANDPDIIKQAYLTQINARSAWTLTTGSAQTVVAVIDSGVDIDHPDLKQNIWVNPGEIPGDRMDNDNNGFVDDVNGWDFVNDIPDVKPKFGGNYFAPAIHHGTLISGMIAGVGNNGIGISGISWRTKIMPLRVLDNKGDGEVLNVIRAIDYATAKKVDVINVSFVGNFDNPLLKDAVKRASDAGIIVIAAAGNDRQNNDSENGHPVYPACYSKDIEGVIGVSSLDPLGQKAPFSDYGNCTDISAPGMDLYSTQAVNYEYPGFDAFYGSGWSGTSLSTALVSGAIALLKSISPHMSVGDMKRALREGCDPIDDLNSMYKGQLGCGQMNIGKTLRSAIASAQSVREQNPFDESDHGRYPIAISTADGLSPLMAFDGRGLQKKSAKDFYPFAPYRIPYAVQFSRQNNLIVFGAQRGGPHVRIFDRDFQLVSQFFAYEKSFRGGITIVVGDVDGDSRDEIVTVPGPGREPMVRIFDLQGKLKKEFLGYDGSFRGGLSVQIGDMNNDHRDEVVTSPLSVNGGDIRIYSDEGDLLNKFYAYPQDKFQAITFAVGDLDADGMPEIVTAPAVRGANVKIFSSHGALLSSVAPFGTAVQGMNVIIGNISRGAYPEIVVSPRAKAGAQVVILNATGKKVGQFFVLPKNWRGGLTLGILE